MTVGQMEELIKDLPKDMEMIMPTGGDTFTTVCFEQSGIIGMGYLNEEEEEEVEEMFVLRPCTCEVDDLPVVPQEQILN